MKILIFGMLLISATFSTNDWGWLSDAIEREQFSGLDYNGEKEYYNIEEYRKDNAPYPIVPDLYNKLRKESDILGMFLEGKSSADTIFLLEKTGDATCYRCVNNYNIEAWDHEKSIGVFKGNDSYKFELYKPSYDFMKKTISEWNFGKIQHILDHGGRGFDTPSFTATRIIFDGQKVTNIDCMSFDYFFEPPQ